MKTQYEVKTAKTGKVVTRFDRIDLAQAFVKDSGTPNAYKVSEAMKLHFFDDSIDGAACGAKSDHSTDNGLDVTCDKCRKIADKLHKDVAAMYAHEEMEAKTHRGYEI